MMDICIATYDKRIVPNMLATKGVGAGEHCVVSLAVALRDLGHKITVTGVGFDSEVGGIQWGEEHKGRFDWVICHRDVNILNEPHITTVKSLWGIDAGPLPPAGLMLDYVIPISENLRDIVWMNYDAFVIPLGIDVTKSNPNGNNNRYNLLFCGAVIECRGIMQAANIWRQLYEIDNRYHLHIIGSAQTWGDDIELVGNLGIASQLHVDEYLCDKLMWDGSKVCENVQIYGRISTDQVLELLPSMGYQLALRSYETCGVAIIEGQASGVVPIVGDVMCLPERILDEKGLEKYGKIVSGIDEDGVKEAVSYILSDDDYVEISESCIKQAFNYNWKDLAERFVYSFKQYKRETIGIGITNYKNIDIIKNAVTSIRNNVCCDYQLVVFDNSPAASEDRKWLNKQSDITVLTFDDTWEKPDDCLLDNPGNAYAKNRMVEFFRNAGLNYALLMDNDVEVHKSCVETMYRVLKYNPDIGIVGCPHANVSYPEVQSGYVDEIASVCSMVRLKMFKEVGMYPEQLIYYSLDSWHNTLTTMYGWKTYVLPYDLYTHRAHSSGNELTDRQATIDRDKWGDMKRTWATYWERVLREGFE